VQQELGIGYKQYQEAPEEDGVVQAEDIGTRHHPFLPEGKKQHVAEAPADLVKTVVRFTDGNEAEPQVTAEEEKPHCNGKQRAEY
jgi:hypothetical protein